jgi:hypothetical protein
MSWVQAAIAGGAALVGAAGSIIGGNKAAKAMEQSSNDANAMSERIYGQQRADQMPYMQSGYQALNALNRLSGLGPVDTSVSQYSAGVGASGGLRMTPILHGKKAIYVDADGNGFTQAVAGNNRGQWIPTGTKHPEYAMQKNQPVQSSQPGQTGQAPVGDDRYGGFYESPGYQFRLDQGVQAMDRSAAARGLLLSGAQNKALTRFGQGIGSEEFGNHVNRLSSIAGLGQVANQSVAGSAGQYGVNAGNAIMNAGMSRASGYANIGNTLNSFANNIGSAAAFMPRNPFGTATAYDASGNLVNRTSYR